VFRKIEKTFRSEEFCHLGTNFAVLSFNLKKKKTQKKKNTKKTRKCQTPKNIGSTYLVEASELCVDGDRELWLPAAEAIVGSSKLY